MSGMTPTLDTLASIATSWWFHLMFLAAIAAFLAMWILGHFSFRLAWQARRWRRYRTSDGTVVCAKRMNRDGDSDRDGGDD